MNGDVMIPPAEEFLEAAILRRIDYRITRLARKFHLRAADRHDLRQDFRLTLVQQPKVTATLS